MVKILWHSQTKGRATVNTNFHLNHRATSRLYLLRFKADYRRLATRWALGNVQAFPSTSQASRR